jgi:hypothetical protein
MILNNDDKKVSDATNNDNLSQCYWFVARFALIEISQYNGLPFKQLCKKILAKKSYRHDYRDALTSILNHLENLNLICSMTYRRSRTLYYAGPGSRCNVDGYGRNIYYPGDLPSVDDLRAMEQPYIPPTMLICKKVRIRHESAKSWAKRHVFRG